MTTLSRDGEGTEVLDVAIIGAGFSGLGMAIELKRRGNDNFIVLEKADDVGGTWRDNQYPGCACDVQSHLYSFSFEPNPEWSRLFARQDEIWAYMKRCSQKYGVLPHIRFNSPASALRWDDAQALWEVTAGGTRYTARAVVLGVGALSRPDFPNIPGRERFAGTSFHSQQWNHDYDLRGKRVAVIGTGASAIQFVPQIAPQVARLDLYQRTPPWVLPKPDRRISRVERWLFRRLPFSQRLFRLGIYWLLELRVVGFALHPRLMNALARMGRRHIEQQIADPVLRRKVTPDYTPGCKRILIANDYFPALTRDNVDVITTGIREITERGVMTADGIEREVDAIIYGTGFKATDPLGDLQVRGRHGLDIRQAWADGIRAYAGTTVAGFPNLFILLGPNTGLGHSSVLFMIESQVRYVLGALEKMRRQGLRAIDVRPEVEQAFNERLQQRLRRAVWSTGCQSWYLDDHGRNVTLWPGWTWRFRLLTRRFRLDDYSAADPVTRTTELEKGSPAR